MKDIFRITTEADGQKITHERADADVTAEQFLQICYTLGLAIGYQPGSMKKAVIELYRDIA